MMLGSGEHIEIDHKQYKLGDIVQVTKGPLMGLIGNLVELQGKHKIVIHIEAIGQNLLATMPILGLQKM